jgi:adenylosuccinate lyase
MAFRDVNFERILRPENFIGRAPKQVDEFIAGVVMPIRKRYRSAVNIKTELDV